MRTAVLLSIYLIGTWRCVALITTLLLFSCGDRTNRRELLSDLSADSSHAPSPPAPPITVPPVPTPLPVQEVSCNLCPSKIAKAIFVGECGYAFSIEAERRYRRENPDEERWPENTCVVVGQCCAPPGKKLPGFALSCAEDKNKGGYDPQKTYGEDELPQYVSVCADTNVYRDDQPWGDARDWKRYPIGVLVEGLRRTPN